MFWTMYLLSNVAVFGIQVKFQGVDVFSKWLAHTQSSGTPLLLNIKQLLQNLFLQRMTWLTKSPADKLLI